MTIPKSVALGVAAAAVALSASSVQAAILVSDSFPHANGDLVGKTPAVGDPWGTHSGATGLVQVSEGKITIVQAGAQDVNVPFANDFVLGAGGRLYAGFDLTVPDPGAPISASNYFAHFLTGTTSFDARIWVTTPTTAGYRLALSNDNSITDADGEVFTGDLVFGQTYRVVTSYDFSGQTAKLWINPVDELSASFNAADPGFSDAAIAYAFRQAGGNATEVIDNLVVATDFASAAVVPEPATLGLLAGGAMGLLARRRRAM